MEDASQRRADNARSLAPNQNKRQCSAPPAPLQSPARCRAFARTGECASDRLTGEQTPQADTVPLKTETSLHRAGRGSDGFYTRSSHEQSASSHQFVVAVNPDIEILVCLISRKRDAQALNDASPLCCGKQQSTEKHLGQCPVAFRPWRIRPEGDYVLLKRIRKALKSAVCTSQKSVSKVARHPAHSTGHFVPDRRRDSRSQNCARRPTARKTTHLAWVGLASNSPYLPGLSRTHWLSRRIQRRDRR